MIANNFFVYSLKIVSEVIIHIAFFPVWWYTRGFFLFLKKIFIFLKNKLEACGLLVWVKNIFRPMYGQNDWQGILISIFMRIVQIIFRAILMIFWLFSALIALLCWLILPIFVFYNIILQLQ